MAKDNKINMLLPTLDELFESTKPEDIADEKVVNLQIKDIIPFPNHPFKVNDVALDEMVESIRSSGVNVPITVRKKDNGSYELISGHRRKRACELLGMGTLRCEIVELDRDSAIIFMCDSNLQRTTILPSEKAFAYKMRLDAMNRQGKRTDLTSTPLVSKSRANERLGVEVGESREQIRRYIRLTELVPELLELVDEGKIALRPAVEISYFPDELQYELLENIELEACTPSHDQTLRMRKLLSNDKLTPESIAAIMQEEKPNQREKIVLRGDRAKLLLPKDLSPSKREEYILTALEYYAKYRAKQRDLER